MQYANSQSYMATLSPTPYEPGSKHRPEKRPNYTSGTLMYEYVTIGTKEMTFQTVDYRSAPGGGVRGIDRETHPTIWRWNDEPGIWRDHAGKILPIEQLAHVPGIEQELGERRILDDRERAKAMVETAFKSGPKPTVVETRGAYELHKSGDHFEVWSHGVPVTPHGVPEPIARGILDTLAPPVEHDLDEEPLERLLAR